MYRSHQFIKRRELNLIAAHSLGSGRLGIPEAAHHDSSCDNPGEASQGGSADGARNFCLNIVRHFGKRASSFHLGN
jgi:hypothetical protein